MGGYTDEAPVSIEGGELVYNSIDKSKYEVYKVVISKEEWYMIDHLGKKVPIDQTDFSVRINETQKLKFDVCFNMVLGNPGENG